MSVKLTVVILVLTFAGCSRGTDRPANEAQPVQTTSSAVAAGSPSTSGATGSPVEATAVKPRVDACALLTSDDIEAVQGEVIKEVKLSGQATGGFNMSQCFFTLPTFTNSIILMVAHRGEGAGAHDPKDFWRETFHESDRDERARERERERKKKARSEEEEESSPPEKVPGVGDEAYWTGSRIGSALYVLKGNSYLRISIGGPADQATRKKKSKTLAEKAVARL